MNYFYKTQNYFPALEKNILKFRAFEMLLILFYVEEIRSFTLGSIKATDKLRNKLSNIPVRIPDYSKGVYKKVWRVLLAEEVLKQDEINDIKCIIDYRNNIAHDIHKLTCDISNNHHHLNFDQHEVNYDYDALNRIKSYVKKIHNGMSKKFILCINFNKVYFESAERTFKHELMLLHKKITRLYDKRKSEIGGIEIELARLSDEYLNEINPNSPNHFKSNGQLTNKGVKYCYNLFEKGLSNTAICYLMQISLKSITNRKKQWNSFNQKQEG